MKFNLQFQFKTTKNKNLTTQNLPNKMQKTNLASKYFTASIRVC